MLNLLEVGEAVTVSLTIPSPEMAVTPSCTLQLPISCLSYSLSWEVLKCAGPGSLVRGPNYVPFK